MEELNFAFALKGLSMVNSSEMIEVRGGTAAQAGIAPALKKLVDIIRKLGTYLPDFLNGLKDGLN